MIHSRRHVAVIALALAISLRSLAPHAIGAQATTVSIHGFVSGSDGSVPQGAQVEVRSHEMGVVRRAVAGDDGAYRVLGLAPGAYDVSVRALGYRLRTSRNVRLIVGQDATLHFTLERGAAELAAIVTTGEHDFEVRRVDISTAILGEEIAKLPLNTRNVLNLSAIAPGIRTFAPEAGRSVPAAGAIPAVRHINLYVDGVEWKGMYIGNLVGQPGLGSLVPQEAVREFRVYLNPYDAEYTRGASWVMSAVTHRGANVMEGSLFGYLQNRPLVARGSFQDAKPDYVRVQMGGNVRGPLVKNRLFFSLTYEDEHTDNYIDVVPGRPAESPDVWSGYAGTFRSPLRLHNGLLRLTAPLGSHTLDAIWASRHVTTESAFGTSPSGVMLSRDAGVFLSSRVNSFQLMDTWASSAFVNEFTLHVLDNRNDEFPLAPGPTLRYPGIQIGTNTFPVLIDSRHLRVVNKTSYNVRGFAGHHVLKSGLELTHSRTVTDRPSNRDGWFSFPSDTSSLPSRGQIGISVADPSSTRGSRVPNTGWLVGAYLQDEWQPVPRLTVTAGVRYDAEINTLNQHFVAPWADDTTLVRALGEDFLNNGDRENDLDNIAPRIALSWDVSGIGRTFARLGYGVMYDRVPVFGAMDERITSGWRTYEVQDPGTTDPAELRQQVISGAGRSTPRLVLLKDRLEAPANHQWSIGVGHQVTERLALNVDYLSQAVRNAYVTTNPNWRNRVTGQRAITNRYADIIVWDDFGDAQFDALLLSLVYDRAPGRLSLAYTLGWSQSEFGALTTSDFPDSSSYTMQRSDGDERHRVALSGFGALPYGLELSGIAIVASPRPFLVTTGVDDNQNTTESDDWPNGIRTRRRDGWDHWYRTLDLRVARSFPRGRGRFSVTAEAFNLFSFANHSEYQAKQNLLGYGEPIGDFARRQGQLGVRYDF